MGFSYSYAASSPLSKSPLTRTPFLRSRLSFQLLAFAYPSVLPTDRVIRSLSYPLSRLNLLLYESPDFLPSFTGFKSSSSESLSRVDARLWVTEARGVALRKISLNVRLISKPRLSTAKATVIRGIEIPSPIPNMIFETYEKGIEVVPSWCGKSRTGIVKTEAMNDMGRKTIVTMVKTIIV